MSLKEVVTDEILATYREKGLIVALDKAEEYLKQTERGSDERQGKATIKGELAEATLLCQLLTLQKSMRFKTIILKGVFVKDKNTDFVTEIDVIFLTPFSIYLIECKSYSGLNKEIREMCSLYRKGEMIGDAYKQNKLHLTIFNRRYGRFTVKDSKPYKLLVYDYATNHFKDTRDSATSRMFPVLNENTFMKWITEDIYSKRNNKISVDIEGMYSEISKDIKMMDSDWECKHRKQLNY